MPLIPLPKLSATPDAPAPVLDNLRRPTVDNTAVSRGVQELANAQKMPELNADKLSAPYEALGAVGQAVTKAGGVIGALADKRQESLRIRHVSAADDKMTDASTEVGTFMSENRTAPEKWVPFLEKKGAALKSEFDSNADITPEARSLIEMKRQRWLSDTRRTVQGNADATSFRNTADIFLAHSEDAIQKQDPKRQEAVLNEALKGGYIFQHDAAFQRERMRDVGIQLKKQAKAALVKSAQDDAIIHTRAQGEAAGLAYLDSVKGVDPSDMEILRSNVRTIGREQTTSEVDSLDDAIASGAIANKAQLDAYTHGRANLRPSVVLQAEKSIVARNDFKRISAEKEDQRLNGRANYIALYPRVMDYDPSKDLDGGTYYDLRREVRSRVGDEDSGFLRNVLYKKRTGKPPELKADEAVKGWFHDRLEAEFDPFNGAHPWKTKVPIKDSLGGDAIDSDGNVKYRVEEDPKARAQAIGEQWELKQAFDLWMKTSPKEAQTIGAAQKKFQELKPEGLNGSAFDAILNAYERKTGSAVPGWLGAPAAGMSPAQGKVTSYGYTGDLTPDGNSEAGIGAFVPDDEAAKIKSGKASSYKLRDGDLAVSPDVEASLRGAGVKPMDEIMVKLENGETRRMRWADKTKETLKGRWDFYSPHGVHSRDGMRVVGWAPVK